MACREMEGYGIETPVDAEGEKRRNFLPVAGGLA
jgi:hypothetical protein